MDHATKTETAKRVGTGGPAVGLAPTGDWSSHRRTSCALADNTREDQSR